MRASDPHASSGGASVGAAEALRCRLSIIVPALDESACIETTLRSLQSERAKGAEIIVVDGGSGDDTAQRARPLADRVIVTEAGRGAQMNVGARLASGRTLLFLHADTRMSPAAFAALDAALRARKERWGRFDLSIEGRAALLRVVARMISLRSRFTGIATGDQGIFVARALFERVGGYREIALMEDVALCASLKRAAGRPLCIAERICTSGRRWERKGTWRTIVLVWRLRLQFWLGHDPAVLARHYER